MSHILKEVGEGLEIPVEMFFWETTLYEILAFKRDHLPPLVETLASKCSICLNNSRDDDLPTILIAHFIMSGSNENFFLTWG